MPTLRFAPSPTGELHLGHADSALRNAEWAGELGGKLVLRIEDIDQGRCRPEFEAAIHRDLAWLGLEFEPEVLRQSDRFEIYAGALEVLAQEGLVYRCFRSRKDLAEAMGAPHQVGQAFVGGRLPEAQEAKLLEAERPYAWRLDSRELGRRGYREATEVSYREWIEGAFHPQWDDPSRHGDVVLGRKDVGTSYHLASVMDDAAQGVDLVYRGQDLREFAGLHGLLQVLLGLPQPAYRHHPMVLAEDGKKLSKRDGAKTLASLRAEGVTPEEIRRRLGRNG